MIILFTYGSSWLHMVTLCYIWLNIIIVGYIWLY